MYPPPPVPKHVPLTDTHPPDTAIPPAYVEVLVFVTVRLVRVVVPRVAVVAPRFVTEIEPELILVFVIDPPVMVGFVIDVFERLSILCY